MLTWWKGREAGLSGRPPGGVSVGLTGAGHLGLASPAPPGPHLLVSHGREGTTTHLLAVFISMRVNLSWRVSQGGGVLGAFQFFIEKVGFGGACRSLPEVIPHGAVVQLLLSYLGETRRYGCSAPLLRDFDLDEAQACIII